MTPTLYLTRNGLLEPLGQSQVFSYLKGLSTDFSITLITYEKDADWADSDAVDRARSECEAHGITWLPQRFRPKPKIIAPAFSMIRMAWLVWREVRRGQVKLIHARSYIPAAVAKVVSRVTGVPFIFDMRALWPEELITAGRLKRDSLMHRAIAGAERVCLRDAAGVVSLTHAAVAYLERLYPDALSTQRIAVIPTCADLSRFTMSQSQPTPPVHGCIGTLLSGWFRIEWLQGWIAMVAERDPTARFEILTRDDPHLVRRGIDPQGIIAERLTITSRQPHQMPEALKGQSLSVMFYTEGKSKIGSSPTRMAEVLGTGLPVVANDGVGDVARIITDNRVGVLVAENTKAALNTAYDALQELMQDPDLPDRCRAVAQDVFSLDAGTERYRALYLAITQPASP
ncbi:glycosyltransferase [Sulfitobacter sp. JB4-11]|uniref:glycosyltransferase n=1 Tax=Sulfitobacter rhodophyticola TaxID=3238304 RepID=UPI00351723A0